MKHKQRSWKFLLILALCFFLEGMDGAAYAIDPQQLDDFVRLADQGSAQAEYVLGMAFLKGDGVIENESIGKQYLQRAASQGHQDAKNQLDKMEEQSKPIIVFKPNFDTSLPSPPKREPAVKEALPRKKGALAQKKAQKKLKVQREERGKIQLLQIFEIAFGFICFLLSLQAVSWCIRLFLPQKKQTGSGKIKLQGKPKFSYKIITDFKGRL